MSSDKYYEYIEGIAACEFPYIKGEIKRDRQMIENIKRYRANVADESLSTDDRETYKKLIKSLQNKLSFPCRHFIDNWGAANDDSVDEGTSTEDFLLGFLEDWERVNTAIEYLDD